MSVLTQEQINKKLESLFGWKFHEDEIQKTFNFTDFKAALAFVNKVGALADEVNHHPEIEINYNKVEIELSTHAESGVTEKDINLAEKIEKIV